MTMTGLPGSKSVPSARALRRQAVRTGRELGRTVEAFVSKTGRSARVHEKGIFAKGGVVRTAGRLKKAATSHAGRLAKDKKLDSARVRAVRAATMARSNRTVLIAAAGVLTAALLARRSRRARRDPTV